MLTQDLKLWIFRPPLSMTDSKKFESVFSFWKQKWEDVFREIGKESSINSDDLTRQHEILVLFKDERPVAMVCHRYVNLSNESVYSDSYFNLAWGEKEISHLRHKSGTAVIGSQILVDPEFRKLNGTVNMKYLISFLSLEYVQRSNVDVVIGTMRVDKGMHEVFYQAGAETVSSGIPYYGVHVDLVCFYPNVKPIEIPFEYKKVVHDFIETSVEAAVLNPKNKTDKNQAA